MMLKQTVSTDTGPVHDELLLRPKRISPWAPSHTSSHSRWLFQAVSIFSAGSVSPAASYDGALMRPCLPELFLKATTFAFKR